MFRALQQDWQASARAHQARTFRERWALWARSPSLHSLLLYRLGKRSQTGTPPWVQRVGRFAYGLAQPWMTRWTKISLPLGAELGPGIWFAPHQPLVIAPGTRVGSGCRFFGANTLGIGGRPGARGVPTLGDDVTLAPGATVVGPVTVPKGTWVGPSSVVTRTPEKTSIPLSSLRLWGVPARRTESVDCESFLPSEVSLMNDPDSTVVAEEFWKAFRADLSRYYIYYPSAGWLRRLRIVMDVDGLWALGVYRFGRKLRTSSSPQGRWALPLYGVAATLTRWMTGIHLDVDAQIAPGLYIGHSGAIYVGPGVKIGKDSSLSQMCCVAASGPAEAPGAPQIGERVYVGAGCKVLGGIRVGNGAALGANAVIATDVPDNAVMAGVPARQVSQQGSQDFIVTAS